MPEDLDVALRAAVREALPDRSGAADGDLGHWRPDGSGRWSSPAPLRLARASGMPVAHLATRLAERLTQHLSQRLGTAVDGRAVEVAEDGFLVVTPGFPDLAAVVATILGAGPASGRPARPASPMVVDPAVPQRRTLDNPLFVVMWAHARCCVALDAPEPDRTRVTQSATPAERVLILLLADLPRAVGAAGDDPAAVLRRLHDVAAATCRWLDESDARHGWPDESDARHGWPDERLAPDGRPPGWRAVAKATRQVLATGLDFLGLPAPARC